MKAARPVRKGADGKVLRATGVTRRRPTLHKGRGSAQGIAAGVLADVCGKSLSLTGTLLGGYSSTIFHLLYRFSPEIRTDFGRSDEHRWIQRYGFEEHTVGKPDDDTVEDGRNSRRRKFRKTVRERPGLVPSALFHIIGNTVFLRLADVASGLPSYEEQVMLSSMDSEEDATGYSQRSAYNTVYEELRLKLAEALKAGSKRLLATYLQTLLAYPDGCTRGETVFDPRSGDVIVQVPPLSEERLYPKEKALIDMVVAERMEGRRVLVYATHTGTRDITERMDDMLTRHGFRVAVMKADAVAPERREAWVADKVKQGIDVMICHPRLVQTGLDLIDFPTLIWYETEFSVFQSTRKSTVLMGGRFGCDRGQIGYNRPRMPQTSRLSWIKEQVCGAVLRVLSLLRWARLGPSPRHGPPGPDTAGWRTLPNGLCRYLQLGACSVECRQ